MVAGDRRPSSARRGYDRAWMRLRARFLAVHPTCATPGCPRPAGEVDHIQTVRARPDLRLAWSNLRAFCKACHARRTAQDQSGWKKGHGATADGSPAEPGHPWWEGKPT